MGGGGCSEWLVMVGHQEADDVLEEASHVSGRYGNTSRGRDRVFLAAGSTISHATLQQAPAANYYNLLLKQFTWR